jgi:hypothetical protein
VRVSFRCVLLGLIVPVGLIPQQLDFAAAEREIQYFFRGKWLQLSGSD